MEGISKERLMELADMGVCEMTSDELLDTLFRQCKELNPPQPIETAPKDRKILLFGCGIHEIGFWDSEQDLFVDIYRIAIPNPTHWQDLPEAPK